MRACVRACVGACAAVCVSAQGTRIHLAVPAGATPHARASDLAGHAQGHERHNERQPGHCATLSCLQLGLSRAPPHNAYRGPDALELTPQGAAVSCRRSAVGRRKARAQTRAGCRARVRARESVGRRVQAWRARTPLAPPCRSAPQWRQGFRAAGRCRGGTSSRSWFCC